MAQTGYGRTSSLNRIQYYKGSNSRTYRGVKTPKMVASMSLSMQKAQDQAEKNAFNAGQISTNDYIAYLTKQIATTSDPTYRNTLTQELQTVTVTDNEKLLTQGYTDGTVSAGQVEDYYKNKLATLDPNSQAYQDAQNNVAKYTKLANQDAYKAQEAVLKEQYNGAADKLSSAQKLLDFYIQQSQTLTPGTPDYNTAVQNIGTYQAEVRKISFEQQLLKAEDSISQQYAKDTPENWSAKAQLYGQLRDAAAAQGDITNFYKYDQLANTANDNIATSQAKVVSKQINEAIKQTQADYLSGKIDAQTAQDQMQQISDAALQANDTNGVIVAHDYFNKIQNDVTHGVSYGEDNGFGKAKGGSGGDSGWFDASTMSPLSGGGSSSVSPSSSTTATSKAVSTASTVAQGGVATSETSKITDNTPITSLNIDTLNQLSQVTKVQNIASNPNLVVTLQTMASGGATFGDMTLFLRTQKVGTGDGWKAMQEARTSDLKLIAQEEKFGYNPQTGQPFTQQDYTDALRGVAETYVNNLSAWKDYTTQNPNVKLNINGVNKKAVTLGTTIDSQLNGTIKTDAAGDVTSDTPGALQELQILSTPGYQAVYVQNKNNPSVQLSQSAVAQLQDSGLLDTNYVQATPGHYYYINNIKPQKLIGFATQDAAQTVATEKGGIVQPDPNGGFMVVIANKEPKNFIDFTPSGQKVTYVLNPDNTINHAITPTGSVLNTNKLIPINQIDNMLKVQQSDQMFAQGKVTPDYLPGKEPLTSKSLDWIHANASQNVVSLGDMGNYLKNTNGAHLVGDVVNGIKSNFSYQPGQDAVDAYNNVKSAGSFIGNNFINPAFNPTSQPLFNVVQPLIRPIDQLIQSAFNLKPLMKIAPPSVIPANTPLRTSSGNVSFPQQTQQVNQPQQIQTQSSLPLSPSAPSAPLNVAGSQPQNNMQVYGPQNPQFSSQVSSIVNSNKPNTNSTPQATQPNWLANAAGNFGKALDSGISSVSNAVGNFFGGFHF